MKHISTGQTVLITVTGLINAIFEGTDKDSIVFLENIRAQQLRIVAEAGYVYAKKTFTCGYGYSATKHVHWVFNPKRKFNPITDWQDFDNLNTGHCPPPEYGLKIKIETKK